MLNDRGLKLESIKHFRLGYEPVSTFYAPAIVIPHLDMDGKVCGIKYRHLSPDIDPKYIYVKGSRPFIYNAPVLLTTRFPWVIITEGEIDCISLRQLATQLPAIGFPGMKFWKDRWLKWFERFERIYIAFDQGDQASEEAEKLAKILKDYRCYRVLPPSGVKDINELLTTASQEKGLRIWKQLMREAKCVGVPLIKETREYTQEVKEAFFGAEAKVQSTGFPALDSVTGGLLPGRVYLLKGNTGLGKALKNTEKVRGLTSWYEIGTIEVGTKVMGVDGKPYKVTGVYPQGLRDMYIITFGDGSKISCDGDHLWTVYQWKQNNKKIPCRWKELVTKSTIALLQDYKRCYNRARYWVPPLEPMQFEEKVLPIPPYTLGVLLGDGCLVKGTPRVSTKDKELLDYLRADGIDINPVGRVNKGRAIYDVYCRGLMDRIRALGLEGTRSSTKFIPRLYLEASLQQRVALLQGLMDTDGYASPKQGVKRNSGSEYCSISEHLVKDMAELVKSLGGYCHTSSRQPSYTHKGKKLKGQKAYRCRITFPEKLKERVKPFRLSRKKDIFQYLNRYEGLPICDIKKEDKKAEATCITTTAPDKLFITTGYIPTHNTTFVLHILLNAAQAGGKVLIGSFEMKVGKEMILKVLGKLMGRNFEKYKDLITETQVDRMITSVSDFLPVSWINRHDHLRMGELYDAVKIKYQVGYRFLLLDHAQFMMGLGKEEAVYSETAKISRFIKRLTNDFPELTIWLITELNSQEGTFGGKSLEYDSDVVLSYYGTGLECEKHRVDSGFKGKKVQIRWNGERCAYTVF